MYLVRDNEGHLTVCLTLTLKVNRQGRLTFFDLFEISELELIRIDTKIKCVSCMQTKIRKVI